MDIIICYHHFQEPLFEYPLLREAYLHTPTKSVRFSVCSMGSIGVCLKIGQPPTFNGLEPNLPIVMVY